MDFLLPSAGLVGAFRLLFDLTFSLLSSSCCTLLGSAGEAGIVLRRFFSRPPALRSVEEDKGLVLSAVLGVVRPREVVAGFLTPGGLVTDVLDIVLGRDTGVFAGVVGAALVAEPADGANDTLLGFADKPSFFASSTGALPSVELFELRFVWVGPVTLPVLGVLRVLATPGRVGGLLREVAPDVFAADVEVVLVDVERRGAVGVVTSLLGGTLPSARDDDRSAIAKLGKGYDIIGVHVGKT